MAYDPTANTKATLVAETSWPTISILSPFKKKVREIYYKAKALAAIGGTDYTSDFPALQAAANCITQGMTPADLDTLKVINAYKKAVASGATISTDKDVLATAEACLKNQPENALDSMNLELDNLLGAAKAYPQ